MLYKHDVLIHPAAVARVLSTPITFTDDAWLQVIAKQSRGFKELGERLNCTIRAIYKAVLSNLHKRVVVFGMPCFPSDGDVSSPLWIDLQVRFTDDTPQQQQLQVSLISSCELPA